MEADPDLIYGLPIMRARSALVPPDLWHRALQTSAARSQPRSTDRVPPGSWRLEVFAPRLYSPNASGFPSEGAALLPIEAERQNAFYAVSLNLGRRLLAGDLEGFGRSGSMAGPWVKIPSPAWQLLRVEQSDDFVNWHLGHLIGAGLDLWSVRILDRVGLSFDATAIAYGPADAARIAQSAEVFGVTSRDTNARPPPAPGSLAAKMAYKYKQLSLLDGEQDRRIAAKARDAAIRELHAAELALLRDGVLIAELTDGDGRKNLTPESWSRRPSGNVLRHVLVRPNGEPVRKPAKVKATRRAPARTDFTLADRPLIEEMRVLLEAKPPKARHKTDAALQVVGRAEGSGTMASKAARLAKRYSDVFSD